MKTLLIFPPQGHFTQPYLALPSLQAYLKQEGFVDTHLMDANIEAYDWLLSRDRLEESARRIHARGRFAELDNREALGYSEMVEYRAFSQAELVGDWVVDGIEDAKAVMRDPQRFYDREAYTTAARCIEQGLALISAEHYPSHLSAHGFSMQHSLQSTDQILAGAVDEQGNPFLEFFREVTMPQIEAMDPDLIGISLTYGSQAIPALALARLIKQWKPEVHITCGGGLLAYIGHKLAKRPEVFDLVDSLVLLEGERPLLGIAQAVEAGRDLAGVANTIYRDASGMVVINQELEPLSIDTFPTPDFSGLPLELYFSPEFIVPLAITRGCYWAKCVFCTLHDVIGPGYRGRSIERVVEDIRQLQEQWGAKRFYFPIEDLPPNMVMRLPQAILDAGLEIEWWCDAKLEPEVYTPEVCAALAASGCRRLAFGYESSSGRLLDLMSKGSQPGPGMEVIRRVHDAGISVTLYVMVGFPTETEQEAQLTLDTLLANRDYFEEVSMRVFYLDDKSEVFRRRADFDIVEVFEEEGMDLQVYHDFRTSSGMSRQVARRKYLQMLSALKSRLPVFQNRNLLYHELKSHYFLHLARAGGVEELLAGPFAETPRPGLDVDSPLQSSEALRRLPCRFDRDAMDAAIDAAVDGLTLPRYQFDLIADKDLEALQAKTPALQPDSAVLILDENTGEIACLSRDGMTLLDSLQGALSIAEILDGFEDPIREQVRGFLDQVHRSGLITQSQPVGAET